MAEWHGKGIEIDLLLIGNKAAAFFRALGGNVVAAINEVGEAARPRDSSAAIKVMLDAFADGRIDQLDIISNDFVNTMTQAAHDPPAPAPRTRRTTRP